MRIVGGTFSGTSLEIFLDLFTLLLDLRSQISQHFLVIADHFVTIDLVLDLATILGTHLEAAICLLSQVALA